MSGKDWLNEMMDAALEDAPETRTKPDYTAVRRGSVTLSKFPFTRAVSFRIILAAAALFLALPGGVLLGRRVTTLRMMRDESDLFVQELLGESIFEETFVTLETWHTGLFLDDGLFGLSEDT